MRRRDCVRNLDTPSVCAKKHRQMTIKCATRTSSCSVAYCGHMVRHCTRASRELVGEICHPRFEWEIELVRM